jgi:Spirocyclase AveC-like
MSTRVVESPRPAIAPRPVATAARDDAGRPIVLWLAAAGAVLGFWMVWTLVAWATSGHVHQVAQYREHGQASWVAAHVYEAVFATLTLGLTAYVLRGVWRERRLTFDAMLLFALFTSSWLDPAFNFYKQIFLYSSQFVNVNAWCGKMPGILNHQCGRMPEPLVIPLLYMQVLLAATIASRLVAGAQARAGRWSVGRTLALAGAFGIVFDFAMEMPSLALHLWSYASGPDGLAPPGLHGAARYSLTTAFTFGFICASVTALRYHRDDRGRTLLERASWSTRARWRPLLLTLAVIGWVQLTVIVSFAPAMLAAPYAGAWPHGLPRPLVNGLCDNNSRGPTPYPCPRRR